MRCLCSALVHNIVADFLTLDEASHTSALHRRDVNKYVRSAIGWFNETEALLGVEKLHCTYGHFFAPFQSRNALSKLTDSLNRRANVRPPKSFYRRNVCLRTAPYK